MESAEALYLLSLIQYASTLMSFGILISFSFCFCWDTWNLLRLTRRNCVSPFTEFRRQNVSKILGVVLSNFLYVSSFVFPIVSCFKVSSFYPPLYIILNCDAIPSQKTVRLSRHSVSSINALRKLSGKGSSGDPVATPSVCSCRAPLN